MLGVFLAFPLVVLKGIWWFVTPYILFRIVETSWLYFIVRKFILSLQWSLLEIKLPQEVLKTPKAMEYVLAGLHGVWDDLNLRDIWIRGEVQIGFSLEIVGTAGEIHFYIMAQKKFRNFVESQVYAQYPDAEIQEVQDYTANVPPDIPNKDWDLWGADLTLVKPSPYPIRTYVEFEEMVEERRIDPMASIAEILNKLRVGEHIWIQFLITPPPKLDALRKEGEAVVAKLMKRKVEEVKKGFAGPVSILGQEMLRTLGMAHGEEKEEEVSRNFPPEWNLSPGERDIIKAIEMKTSKVAFETLIRFVYIGRRDVFSKTNVAALFGYFKQFNTFNLNSFKPNRNTFPKKSFIYFKKIRTHFRKLRLLQWYKFRSNLPGGISPSVLLNVEELATLYHFPGQIVKAPMMPRVLTRKGPAPRGLPIEEVEGEI